MARLPQPGADQGQWGAILNDFLLQSHDTDGSLADNSVTSSHITDGSVTEAKLSTSVQSKLNSVGSGGVVSVNGQSGVVTLTKANLTLDNVDNTSDLNKPVSTATQTALDTKADTSALTSGLAGKANTSHTHTASQISDSTTTGRSVLVAADAAAARSAIGAGTSNLAIGTTSTTAKAGDYTPTKTDVGLGNVDNTSDANKPISTATQTALNAKADSTAVGAKLLLIDNAAALPAGTPAGIVVVVKA